MSGRLSIDVLGGVHGAAKGRMAIGTLGLITLAVLSGLWVQALKRERGDYNVECILGVYQDARGR
jgi:hypothetical protein